MPLSDREQHMLEQLEQQLIAEDPKFASHMRGGNSGLHRGRVALAVVAVIAGLALVLTAVNFAQTWIGAIGFAIMVAGVAYAVTPAKKSTGPQGVVQSDGSTNVKPASGGKKSRGTFMERIEQRWERRRNGW
ncbi:MAG: DUF3040 domain-containing protein [Nostocoides sp.]